MYRLCKILFLIILGTAWISLLQGQSGDRKKHDFDLYFLVRQHTYFDKAKASIDNYPDFRTLYTSSWGWDASLKFDFNQRVMVEFGYGNRYHYFNFWRSFAFNAPFQDSLRLSASKDPPHTRREYIFVGLGLPFQFELRPRLTLQITPAIQLYKFTKSYRDSIVGHASYGKWPDYKEREYFPYSYTDIYFNGGKKKHYERLPFVPTIQLSTSLLWFIPKWNRYLRLQLSYSQTMLWKQPESAIEFDFYGTDGALIKHISYKSYMRSLGVSFGLSF